MTAETTALDRALALADEEEAHFRDLRDSTCGGLAYDALVLIAGLREAAERIEHLRELRRQCLAWHD